jgi:DNA mismatch endonuclease (patch repair protein)
VDIFEPQVRSYVMSRIKKTNTKPELIVRSFLFRKGLRFRIHRRDLPGNPDIILKKYKIVVFVNGCFWHGHKNCKLHRMPKSRPEYWIPKIEGNVSRDHKNQLALSQMGWNVLTIWECQIRRGNEYLNELYKSIRKVNLFGR